MKPYLFFFEADILVLDFGVNGNWEIRFHILND